MYQELMHLAAVSIRLGLHTQALSYLNLALPMAAKGKQWSMTMTAIRHTMKAGKIINA